MVTITIYMKARNRCEEGEREEERKEGREF
jgi:hypothetical protein